MRIAIMGAGALGGYFGGLLAAKGHDVALIARGAHLQAMQETGLTIRSTRGDLHIPKITATDDPETLEPADVVLFTVKNYDVVTSAHAIAPLLRSETMVVTRQNGVSAPDRLGEVIGHERVVPAVARIPADIPEPGVINHSAMMNGFTFGETSGELSPRVRALRDALVDAGLSAEVSENILHDLWRKFISQATLASLTALTRLNIGPLRSNPESRALFLAAMRETEKVGRAVVPDLPEGATETAWKALDKLPDAMHASMLDDLLAGKRLEVDDLSGDVVRLGATHGVPTPLHAVFWAALQPMKTGGPALETTT